MHLCITGFLAGDSDDTSLKYELDVQSGFEKAVLEVMGWQSLAESPEGEWLLTGDQSQRIATVINEPLPRDLDLFIGVEA
ncbi:pyocin S6 family toxin immunity protein [Pseudomonas umsongensis]|uniref:pyocin S6 family toxin immunity protein n=1 Tax=Pseudomonas umsongensis TaxID=198618 RepID=UPI00200A342F|nr:pyocin S6 family toxin immunity protein [Pseudomonas umsongensis]MCK8686816.1 pyocin S6 family toxin immunity protein [Pseudomonas umsongensis]